MFVLARHVLSVMLVVGTLFMQSLMIVFCLRLSNRAQFEGVLWVQNQVHQLIYYPNLDVAVISGIYLTLFRGRFISDGNGWLYIKNHTVADPDCFWFYQWTSNHEL